MGQESALPANMYKLIRLHTVDMYYYSISVHNLSDYCALLLVFQWPPLLDKGSNITSWM